MPVKADVGKEIVIIGNGPSLKETLEKSFTFFEGKSKMCVNSFVLTDYFEKLKPEYYIFADPGFFIEEPVPATLELREKIKKALADKVKWEMTVFLPVKTDFFAEIQKQNKNFKVVYFNKTKTPGFQWFRHFLYNHRLGMPPVENVMVAGVMLSIHMGFSKIFLAGADHSWHENIVIDKNNSVCFYDVHFYDKDKSDVKLVPVIHPITKTSVKAEDVFFALVKALRSYTLLEKYSKTKGAKIYNASPKTYIDAFERIDAGDFPKQ